jgi:hypothetical protein
MSINGGNVSLEYVKLSNSGIVCFLFQKVTYGLSWLGIPPGKDFEQNQSAFLATGIHWCILLAKEF